MQLINGDCLEAMAALPDSSIDMVLTDLPYGTTACKWDSVLPLDELWSTWRRVAKDAAPVVLTAAQPFTTTLINSNSAGFRYAWVWDKKFAGNFVQAKRMPLRIHEDVLVFSFRDGVPAYYPQMEEREKPIWKGGNRQSEAIPIRQTETAQEFAKNRKRYDQKYPTTILSFSCRDQWRGLHPTQKPVALMEYLINTYTEPGAVVLDCCMGSGTTGVAAINTGRDFIGIERDPNYYEIAQQRIVQPTEERQLFLCE